MEKKMLQSIVKRKCGGVQSGRKEMNSKKYVLDSPRTIIHITYINICFKYQMVEKRPLF